MNKLNVLLDFYTWQVCMCVPCTVYLMLVEATLCRRFDAPSASAMWERAR